ncbi:hypothetical protein A2866_04680 [Candidatus Roizmanbacteria bacterium RIFCSPHIGHO2_01_FULL_39_8]|uniref:GIY-YIG domain-containing protein n=2 Tax=Candidatus Roizmaniibacteriota TaxID=1752723 RepID=A0A1F7GMX5_9BACT|nr:MAG: hypothetical protein A2866_04680 [Candidatus Roizmanbacteria bacterium RIFCSPHIGHO2_01_FULL_39_8]OGK28038.1 MAG: hypothetical protein A3C28_02530 [Candidatus Roizmanbacteria bacterium RIFCSPHIGHO2_02_FULL_39_9]
MSFYVYILSNVKRTVFYIGVTNNLRRRIYEHKEGIVKGFSSQYILKYLVYFEEYKEINSAISREKQLKNWRRQWKINLIKKKNPKLEDLTKNW